MIAEYFLISNKTMLLIKKVNLNIHNIYWYMYKNTGIFLSIKIFQNTEKWQ